MHMKNITRRLPLLLLVAFAFAAVQTARAADDRVKVIFDTDIGGDPDDGLALTYLLKEPRCNLIGITTTAARPELCAHVASALCQSLGRKDIPIRCGCTLPINIGQDLRKYTVDFKKKVHTWDDELKNWPHDEIACDYTAVEFLRQTIRANPGEVVLFTSAQFSNVAALFAVDPEIPALLKRLVVVGCDLEGIVDWDGFVDPYATAALLEGGFRTPPKELFLHNADVTTPLNLPVDEGRAYTSRSPDLRFLRGYYAEQWYARPHNLYFHDPIAAVAIFHPEICTYEPSAIKIDVNDRGISYRTKDPTKWVWQTLRKVDFAKFREIYLSVMSK